MNVKWKRIRTHTIWDSQRHDTFARITNTLTAIKPAKRNPTIVRILDHDRPMTFAKYNALQMGDQMTTILFELVPDKRKEKSRIWPRQEGRQ